MFKRLVNAMRRFLHLPTREQKKRICARCGKQIKKHHRWSAKAWISDPRPRHWNCEDPTLTAAQPPLAMPEETPNPVMLDAERAELLER